LSRTDVSWGYHLLLNCRACDREAIASENTIRLWCRDLLQRIAMRPIGNAIVIPTGMHEERLAGYTLIQVIETSSITAHFVDSTGSAYIDVFSCRDFDTSDVEDCVRRHFRPEHIGRVFLERQA